MANERLPEQSIPDRSPGHAFVPIAHAGWCRHTKVEKLGALVDGRVQVSSVPRTPPLAGDKPQRYIFLATLAVVVRATVVGVAGRRRGSFIPPGTCVPIGAGTPRYANWMHWLVREF